MNPNRKRKVSKSSSCKENEGHCDPLTEPGTRKLSHPRGQSQSCHQCRQSIFSSKGVGEMKLGQKRVKCSSCTRYWCENCLKNRYGLDRSSLDTSSWACPVCQKACNCSLCRRKNGKLATGILTPVVKDAGFTSVSDFLENGTDDIAKCLQWKQQSKEETISHKTSSSKPILSPPPSKKPKNTHKGPSKRAKNAISNKEENMKEDGVVLTHPGYSITMADKTDVMTSIAAATHQEDRSRKRTLRSGRVVSYVSQLKGYMEEEEERSYRRSTRKKKPAKAPLTVVMENSDAIAIPMIGKGSDGEEEMVSEEKKKLNELRLKALEDIKGKKSEAKLLEKKQKREEAEEKRKEKLLILEQKKKEAMMERERCKAEKALERKRAKEESKIAQQEKLKRAKQLVMDARRDRRAQVTKVAQSVTVLGRSKQEGECPVLLESDSPDECDIKGIPRLPDLQLFQLDGIPEWCVPKTVFVCEFIHSFAAKLDVSLSKKEELLDNLLQNSHLVHKLLNGLFGIVAETDDELKLVLANKKNGARREIIKLVCEYLRKSGCQDDIIYEYDRSPEWCISILYQLCLSVIQSESFGDLVESRVEQMKLQRKELQLKKTQIVNEMKHELGALCDNDGTQEDVEKVKTAFEEKLKAIQSQYLDSDTIVRGQYLGKDRYDRIYWRLRSFPGVIMVESAATNSADGHNNGYHEGGNSDPCGIVWSVIDTKELLDIFIESLHKTGYREGLLHQSLSSINLTLFS